MSILKNRYEVMALVEAKMCNPNGDPDMANRPRVDIQTGRGIITDVAFKSRMRNYVLDAYNGEPGCNILMQNGANLNRAIAAAVLKANDTDVFDDKNGGNKKVAESAELMCDSYWDVRTFGAVLSTGLNAGQVRGAVQVGMSLSVDPVDVNIMGITRKCYAEGKGKTLNEYDISDENKSDDVKRTMGDKAYIPYGLYVLKMSVSANLARKVGFTENDFKILLESLVQMYNNDVSSSKMGMSVVTPVIVFKHVGRDANNAAQNEKEALLGCASAYTLFDLLKIEKKQSVTYPREFGDYNVSLHLRDLPDGVECYVKRSAFEDLQAAEANDDSGNLVF